MFVRGDAEELADTIGYVAENFDKMGAARERAHETYERYFPMKVFRKCTNPIFSERITHGTEGEYFCNLMLVKESTAQAAGSLGGLSI